MAVDEDDVRAATMELIRREIHTQNTEEQQNRRTCKEREELWQKGNDPSEREGRSGQQGRGLYIFLFIVECGCYKWGNY